MTDPELPYSARVSDAVREVGWSDRYTDAVLAALHSLGLDEDPRPSQERLSEVMEGAKATDPERRAIEIAIDVAGWPMANEPSNGWPPRRRVQSTRRRVPPLLPPAPT